MASVRTVSVKTSAGNRFSYVQVHRLAKPGRRGQGRVLCLGTVDQVKELVALLQSFLARQSAEPILSADLGQGKGEPPLDGRQARDVGQDHPCGDCRS